MTDDKKWQEDLDDFLANKPPSPDVQVLARSYELENITEIESALSIEQHIDEIGLQEVPLALQERLQAIGTTNTQIEQTEKANKVVEFPKWRTWMAIGGIAASVGLVSLLPLNWHNQALKGKQPTLAEINQAKHDLAIAFTYLSKANTKSTAHIKQTINSNLQRPIVKGVAQQLNKLRNS